MQFLVRREVEIFILLDKFKIKDRAVRSFYWMFSANLFLSLTAFISIIIISRLISPTEYGYYAAAMVIITLVNVLARFGIGQALIQSQEEIDSLVSTAFALSLIFSFSAFMIIYFSRNIIANLLNMPNVSDYLRLLSITYLINSPTIVGLSLMEKKLDFRQVAIANLVAYFFGYFLFAIIFALNGFGGYSLVYGQLATSLVLMSIIFYLRPFNFQVLILIGKMRKILRFGSGFTIAKFGNVVATECDSLLVGYYLGAENLGLYNRSYQIMKTPVSAVGTTADKVCFLLCQRYKMKITRLGIIITFHFPLYF